MISAHNQDILLCEMVAEKTQNAALQTFIQEALPKLRAHVDEARLLLAVTAPESPLLSTTDEGLSP